MENEFVMVNQSNRRGSDDRQKSVKEIRKSHIIRQIEEGQLGVKEDDYDQDGNLNLEHLQ